MKSTGRDTQKNSMTYSLEDIDQVARVIFEEIKGCGVVTLTGGLGAGKTTFVSSLLKIWGIPQGLVISPTFTYINSYVAPDGTTVYHFDLYRLKDAAAFEGMGFFEYLDQPKSIVFIEWPEIIDTMLAGSVCRLHLSVTQGDKRTISWEITNKEQQ